MPDLSSRRPLKSRDVKAFRRFATFLAERGCSPNAISFSSVLFGAGAGLAFAMTSFVSGWPARLGWLLAAVFIQLRLLANLFDGMVAVEGGRAGPTGGLWNEAPDRVADMAILIGAGYAAGSLPLLGFGAALGAVFVAYVRALGASLGAGQIFLGPQAKPQRMALLTGCALVTMAFPSYQSVIGLQPSPLIAIGLAAMSLGCVVTASRRLKQISAFLQLRASI